MTTVLSYSMPAEASDWVERIEAACRVVEVAFGVVLAKASAYRAGDADTEVADRPSFLRRKSKSKTRWLHLFSDAPPAHAPSCSEGDGYCAVSGCSYANQGVYNLGVQFPDLPAERVEALFVALGDAVSAYSAHYSPTRTARRLNAIHWRPADMDTPQAPTRHFEPQELRLPRLVNALYQGLASPLQPQGLGWLNYWSDQATGYIGFPHPERDGDLLRDAYRTPAGAWLVKTSREPLDLSKPEHLDRLVDAYERFPRLAVRSDG